MEGWIKLHRQLSEKSYYKKDSEKVHLWIHLLISANHFLRQEMLGGKPFMCKSGQFTTGRQQLAKETGISESKIERCLTYFEKIEHQIEQRKTPKNRLIIIKNWNDFQLSEQLTKQLPNNYRTTTEQLLNTPKECKKNTDILVNLKEEKNNLKNETNLTSIGDDAQGTNILARRLSEKRKNNGS